MGSFLYSKRLCPARFLCITLEELSSRQCLQCSGGGANGGSGGSTGAHSGNSSSRGGTLYVGGVGSHFDMSLVPRKNFNLTPGAGGQHSAQFGGGGGGVVVGQVATLAVRFIYVLCGQWFWWGLNGDHDHEWFLVKIEM